MGSSMVAKRFPLTWLTQISTWGKCKELQFLQIDFKLIPASKQRKNKHGNPTNIADNASELRELQCEKYEAQKLYSSYNKGKNTSGDTDVKKGGLSEIVPSSFT